MECDSPGQDVPPAHRRGTPYYLAFSASSNSPSRNCGNGNFHKEKEAGSLQPGLGERELAGSNVPLAIWGGEGGCQPHHSRRHIPRSRGSKCPPRNGKGKRKKKCSHLSMQQSCLPLQIFTPMTSFAGGLGELGHEDPGLLQGCAGSIFWLAIEVRCTCS